MIVIFHPEESLINVLKNLSTESYNLVLVINSCPKSFLKRIKLIKSVYILNNKRNIGLAAALNLGVSFGFNKLNSEFVILFDQDSEPDKFLPKKLLNKLSKYDLSKIACIGPRLLDKKNSNIPPNIKTRHEDIFVDLIPTSGSLISRLSYMKVGPFIDDLFIDSIDHEWCFRAKAKGLSTIISSEDVMLHNMGDKYLLFFGAFKPYHKSPIRHYYIIRNSIFLLGLSYIPSRWRFIEFLKVLRRAPFYVLVSSNPSKTLKLICKALIDGFLCKLGPLKN